MHEMHSPILGTRENIMGRKPIASAIELKKTCDEEVLVGYKPVVMNNAVLQKTMQDQINVANQNDILSSNDSDNDSDKNTNRDYKI
jgi:hypothetical protein